MHVHSLIVVTLCTTYNVHLLGLPTKASTKTSVVEESSDSCAQDLSFERGKGGVSKGALLMTKKAINASEYTCVCVCVCVCVCGYVHMHTCACMCYSIFVC